MMKRKVAGFAVVLLLLGLAGSAAAGEAKPTGKTTPLTVTYYYLPG